VSNSSANTTPNKLTVIQNSENLSRLGKGKVDELLGGSVCSGILTCNLAISPKIAGEPCDFSGYLSEDRHLIDRHWVFLSINSPLDRVLKSNSILCTP
jgi:hypothetical protein